MDWMTPLKKVPAWVWATASLLLVFFIYGAVLNLRENSAGVARPSPVKSDKTGNDQTIDGHNAVHEWDDPWLVSDREDTKARIAKADANWDSGKKAVAVGRYRTLYGWENTTKDEKSVMAQRIALFELQAGNKEEVRGWIKKGLDDGCTLVFNDPEGKALLAAEKKEWDERAAKRAEEMAKVEADAKRKAEEEREKQAAADASASKRQKENLNRFSAAIDLAAKKANFQGITKISVQGDEATVTVVDSFHSLPYQNRLQFAQNLWKAWASIDSPNDVDKARISIVDRNGNEVGGSGFLGGSTVWVQQQ